MASEGSGFGLDKVKADAKDDDATAPWTKGRFWKLNSDVPRTSMRDKNPNNMTNPGRRSMGGNKAKSIAENRQIMHGGEDGLSPTGAWGRSNSQGTNELSQALNPSSTRISKMCQSSHTDLGEQRLASEMIRTQRSIVEEAKSSPQVQATLMDDLNHRPIKSATIDRIRQPAGTGLRGTGGRPFRTIPVFGFKGLKKANADPLNESPTDVSPHADSEYDPDILAPWFRGIYMTSALQLDASNEEDDDLPSPSLHSVSKSWTECVADVIRVSSLVPVKTLIKSRAFRDIAAYRPDFSPFTDNWAGKPMNSRKKILEYVLLGTIGRGAFGKVRLAISVRDRRFYAVKILSKSMLRKQQRGGALQRAADGNVIILDNKEISIMKRLNHPNVVQYKDLYDPSSSDRMYIVQEYMSGGQVMASSKLEGSTPLPEERAREVTIMVLNGLRYLHRQHIAHRDLKPENLLMLADGTVKISDFGAAKAYEMDDTREKNRSTVGTPAFAAPEMCLSERAPIGSKESYHADIWSLGATVYYMVYGRAPFVAKSVFEMYDCICTEPLKFPSQPVISAELKDLLNKLLVKDPFQRMSLEEVSRANWLHMS